MTFSNVLKCAWEIYEVCRKNNLNGTKSILLHIYVLSITKIKASPDNLRRALYYFLSTRLFRHVVVNIDNTINDNIDYKQYQYEDYSHEM